MGKTIRCPKCGKNHVIKKGKRKTKYKTLQVYYYKTCRKRFVRKELKDKTYRSNVVVNAINCYNQGYTLEETSKLVNHRFKVKVSISSLHNWLTEFSNICSFGRIRNEMLKNFKKGEVVFTNSFKHQGLDYEFKYHKAKLGKLASDHSGLVKYLKRFEQGCPSEMFEGGKRCSQIKLDVNIKKSVFV